MPPVTIKSKRLSLTAELPDAVASRLLRLRALLRRGRPGAEDREEPLPMGRLVLSEDRPELRLRHPDAKNAVAIYRHYARPRPVKPAVPLAHRVSQVSWYHTIELPDGIVTPGVYDHRPLVPHYGIPDSLEGKRVLDVASWDGFWAFELERRGGRVTSVDVPRMSSFDFPPPVRDALLAEGLDRDSTAGFYLAREALGSKVERVEGSVYDLDPDTLGTFDFVHVGDLLLHLETPTAALRRIRRVTDGTALIADCFDPSLQAGLTRYHGGWGAVFWWLPALDTLGQMVLDAGFAEVRVHRVYSLATTAETNGLWRASLVATT